MKLIMYFFLVNISLQANSKRPPVDESILEESRNENKKRRGEKPKLKYADVARAGNIMIEIRASNLDVQLGQPDYDNIEHKLALAYVHHPQPRPTEPPKIFQMGLSQGGLWVGAENEFTHQFMLIHVPTFDMPPGTGAYVYEVYGPDNRPYKYFKTNVPVRFWGSRMEFEDIIIAFHPQLTEPLKDRYGNPKIPHLRISSGMENPQDIKNGYFPIVLEVDEILGPALGRLGGVLNILSTKLRLVGGGIEKYISEAKNTAEVVEIEEAEASEPAVDMEYLQSAEIPLAPPPPPSAAELLPPPPLRQMKPRTPPPNPQD